MPKIESNVHIILVTPLRSFCGSRFSWFAAQPAFTIGLDVVGSQSSVVPVTAGCFGGTHPNEQPCAARGSTRRIHHAVPGAMVSKSRFGCVNRSHLWLASAPVTAQFVPLISAFPDWHWEIRHIVVDGENIAVHFTVTGTHRGPFQGIEATGRRVTVSEFTLYRVEDGKFAEVWDLTDMDAVMRQIRQGEAPSTAPR
jgi:predicted ester cyclase